MLSLRDRQRGCLLGLAVGDAVGTTVEFKARGSFFTVTDLVGTVPLPCLPEPEPMTLLWNRFFLGVAHTVGFWGFDEGKPPLQGGSRCFP